MGVSGIEDNHVPHRRRQRHGESKRLLATNWRGVVRHVETYEASPIPALASGGRDLGGLSLRFCLTRQTYIQPTDIMPCGRKRKRHKIATHKRKKRLRKNRHKKKGR